MDVDKEILKSKEIYNKVYDIIKDVEFLNKSREISLVITKLQEANMWLSENIEKLYEFK